MGTPFSPSFPVDRRVDAYYLLWVWKSLSYSVCLDVPALDGFVCPFSLHFAHARAGAVVRIP